MHSFFRIAFVSLVLVVVAGCSSNKTLDKYIVIVLSEDGTPVNEAVVTPQIIGKNFKSHTTDVAGQVDLRAMYPEMPTSITVRAARHMTSNVKWRLPSPTAQTIILKKF